MLGARNGAGEGDRTLVCSLGSCRSAIELHPRRQRIVRQLRWLAKGPNGSITLANIPISRLACRSFCASSSERFLSTAILISGSSTKRLVPPESVARRFRLPYAHAMASEDTGGRLPQLLDLARLIAREPDTARLVERILMTAKEATGADGGSVYLVEDDRAGQAALDRAPRGAIRKPGAAHQRRYRREERVHGRALPAGSGAGDDARRGRPPHRLRTPRRLPHERVRAA